MKSFSRDDISVVLSYYAEDRPEKLEGLKPGLLDRLPLEEGGNADSILKRAGYLRKVTALVEERRRFGKDAPSMRIAPCRLSPSGASRLLSKNRNFGLIFGAESVSFQDTLQAVYLDGMWSDMNVLGIRMDWLDPRNGKAARALVVDETGLVKDVSFEKAVELDVVQILHLPVKNECEFHREIHHVFEDKDVEILNPYASSLRADDKNRTHELWADFGENEGLDHPSYRMVPSSLDRKGVAEQTGAFLEELKRGRGRGTGGIVIQPNRGTEGTGVRCFASSGDIGPLIEYITGSIHLEDDALLREERGNVRFSRSDEEGYRNIVFRLNAAWDGERFVANSGFAQVAVDETSFVASRGQDGEIIGLREAFLNIYYSSATPNVRIIPSCEEIRRMKTAAEKALRALNSGLSEKEYLKFAGVDLLLEARYFLEPDSRKQRVELFPVLLEINPRPSGLSSSEAIPDMS